MRFKQSIALNLSVGLILYLLFAILDTYLTVHGIGGDIELEGNPIIRQIMDRFGILGGILLAKGMVLLIALTLAITASIGIEREAPWVYFLALTPMTRRWMCRRKRRWVAYLPLYGVALFQGLASASWFYIMMQS